MDASAMGIDFAREYSYPTSFSNATLLALLLSLARQPNSPKTKDTFQDEYDYIIVGSGPGGSALANRLSEVQCATILLLEYGNKPPFLTEIPSLFGNWWETDLDYNYTTTPQLNMGFSYTGSILPVHIGKALGGTSIINGNVYVRGNHLNFKEWEKLGAKGWGYDDVLPYFKRSENNQNDEYRLSGYHGEGGPVTVSDQRYDAEIKGPVLEAARYMGYRVGDANGATQYGFFPQQATHRDGQRCSAAKAFLHPAENRTNLDIVINAHVNKVTIEGDPPRATGVIFDHNNQQHVVRARREVIVSAGTINTPKLLMLSGIGPKEELAKHNIPVFKELPVGKNLMDQSHVYLEYVVHRNFSTLQQKMVNETNIQEYLKYRRGPLSSTAFLMSLAFLKKDEIRPVRDDADFELYLAESSVTIHRSYPFAPNVYDTFYKPHEQEPMLFCGLHLLQPKSRGTVTLASKEPYDPPVIDPQFNSHPKDEEVMIEGMQTCQKIMDSRPVQEKLGAKRFENLYPGCENYAGNEREYFRCFFRQVGLPTWHFAGTARIGDPHDPEAVVDPELRVIGVEALRVVDASVMPVIVSGNTMSTVYMIAEKAADMIKEDFFKNIGSCT